MNSRTRSIRLLVYSHDGFGMGNVRRSIKVCDELSQEIPDLSSLLVTSSTLVDVLRRTTRFDFVKLPSVHRRTRNQYVAKYLHSPYRDVRRLREQLVLAAFRGYSPHLVLVDKVPLGLGDELLPALKWLKSARPKARIVLCLRDILDDAEQVKELWTRRKFFEVLESLYDSIWVFGTQRMCDVAKEYNFPPEIANKVNYCGYMMSPPELRPRDEVRRDLGVTGNLILATAGGGGDGYDLIKTSLQSLRMLKHGNGHSNGNGNGNGNGHGNGSPSTQMVLVLGPEMSAVKRQRLLQLAARTPGVLRIIDFSPELPDLMHAADLVVSMGGYNTLCEILALGKRAIIIPRIHPVSEQWIRARRMHELGLLDVLHPEHLTAASLAAKIDVALSEPQTTPAALVSHLLGAEDLPGIGRLAAAQLCREAS